MQDNTSAMREEAGFYGEIAGLDNKMRVRDKRIVNSNHCLQRTIKLWLVGNYTQHFLSKEPFGLYHWIIVQSQRTVRLL
jgi:hypothetical protein